MTPDERAQLDAYAVRHRMDSVDVDEALQAVGGDAATLSAARAAVAAYAIRRDMLVSRAAHRIIPAARAVIAAWRAQVEPTPEGAAAHVRRLAEALAVLEEQLTGVQYEA